MFFFETSLSNEDLKVATDVRLDWQETLSNGKVVEIRPIVPDDIERERAFFQGLSGQSRHQRFLGGVAALTESELHQLCDIDYLRDMAFVAVVDDGDVRSIVGVARYAEGEPGAGSEIAVTVADEWQNKGLGSALLRHLIQYASELGITRLYSIDAADNGHMRELARDFGFVRQRDPNDATMMISSLELTTLPPPA